MKLKSRRVQRNPLPNRHHPDPDRCEAIGKAARRLIDLTEPAGIATMTLHADDGCWRVSFTKLSERPPGREPLPADDRMTPQRAA